MILFNIIFFARRWIETIPIGRPKDSGFIRRDISRCECRVFIAKEGESDAAAPTIFDNGLFYSGIERMP
jgi:hypothetical protein